MRRVTAIMSVAAVVLMAAGSFAQAKPNFVPQAKPSSVDQAKPSFAGEWKIMVARGQGEPGVDLIITQSATAMTLEYRNGVKLTYTLDGSVSKNMMPARGRALTEQVSKATWAGSNLVVTTTTSAGEEKRTFSMEGGYLVVEISARAPNGGAPNVTKVAYQPYKRGFGG